MWLCTPYSGKSSVVDTALKATSIPLIELRAATVYFLVFLKKRQLVLNVSEPSTEWIGML